MVLWIYSTNTVSRKFVGKCEYYEINNVQNSVKKVKLPNSMRSLFLVLYKHTYETPSEFVKYIPMNILMNI